MRRFEIAIGVAAVSAALLLSVPTVALGESPAYDADAARVLREAGVEAARKGDFETCRAKASESFAKAKQPQSAGLLGLCEAKLHLDRDAAEHLDYAIRFDPKSERVEDYKAELAVVMAHVGAITIESTPDGAALRLDGADAGSAPTKLFVNPGHYRVEATKDGFKPEVKEVDLTAGKEAPIAFKLEPNGPAVVPPGPRPSLVPAVIGFVLGGGALIAAGALAGVANGADPGPGCTIDCVEAQSAQNDLSNASLWTFVAGGAVTAASAVYLIWAVTRPSSSAPDKASAALSWTVAPAMGDGFGGLLLFGRF